MGSGRRGEREGEGQEAGDRGEGGEGVYFYQEAGTTKVYT
jgi:hypothetical protein